MGDGKTAATERIDSASRVILATPRTLFRAFVDPETLIAWRTPDGMSARIERFDPRIGGGYRIILRYDASEVPDRGKSGRAGDIADVRFLELGEDRIVEQVQFVSADLAFADPMMLVTTFEPVADGVKVTITARDVPAVISPEDHKAGIAGSLRNLALLTE